MKPISRERTVDSSRRECINCPNLSSLVSSSVTHMIRTHSNRLYNNICTVLYVHVCVWCQASENCVNIAIASLETDVHLCNVNCKIFLGLL